MYTSIYTVSINILLKNRSRVYCDTAKKDKTYINIGFNLNIFFFDGCLFFSLAEDRGYVTSNKNNNQLTNNKPKKKYIYVDDKGDKLRKQLIDCAINAGESAASEQAYFNHQRTHK